LRRSHRVCSNWAGPSGRNVRIDTRWAVGDAERFRRYATELVALAPDVILAVGAAAAGPLQQATRTVPIVFVNTSDPVGAGFVESLARPGGNATGFLLYEYGTSRKWLELLKEIAPRVTRVAVLRDSALGAGIGQLGAIQAVAPSFGVELRPVDVRDVPEIERAVAAFARASNGGLIVTQGGADMDDPRSQPNITAFLQALQQLGWTDGRNVKIDYRWPAGDADKARKYAAELVALAADVILAFSAPSLGSLLQATRTVPIVFVAVSDPVRAGYVDSLSRPGGTTIAFDNSSSRWLEIST
jgi:ABC-type uncharacterized transport system substrate-binding protein